MADVGRANSNQRTNQKHQNSIKLYLTALTGNCKRRHCAHQKHAKQQNESYSTYSRLINFYRKYADVTTFVIINIFKSNCNLFTYSFSVTVTDYNYIYFVFKT